MEPRNLITTSNLSEQPVGTLIRAKNIVNKYKSGKTNEPGNLQLADYPGSIVGVIATPSEDVIFSVNRELVLGVFKNVSTITRLKNAVSTIIFRSIDANFTTTNPIQGAFEYNHRGDLIVVWWEGVRDAANNIRTVNLDCLPFDIHATTKFILDEEQIVLLELTSDSCPPFFGLMTVRNTGGQLLTGNYAIFTQYVNSDGSRTNPFVNGTVVNIYDRQIQSDIYDVTNLDVSGDDYTLIDFAGIEGGVATGKSIRLVLTNIDTNYDKLVVGAVRISNGVATAFTELEIDITSSGMEYIFTGTVDSTITIEEVLGVNSVYVKAEAGTVLDKRLYLGNLVEDSIDPEVLQQAVNDVVVKWNYEAPVSIESDKPNQSYKDPNTQISIKGFFPDEVYAVYIGFLSYKQQWTILHVPGRVSGTTDWENNSDESDTDSLARPATDLTGIAETALLTDIIAANPSIYLGAMDNAASIGSEVKFFQVFDTSKSDGTMGYWENETEVYPDCFPDFDGQKVRHHKMPSLEQLKRRFSQNVFFDPVAESIPDLEGLSTRVLTLDISNLVIPSVIIDKICYWGVFYAKRDFNNSSHIALGYVSNKQYASETPVQLPLSHTAVTHTDSFRFNNFSLLKDTPTVSPNYIKTHFKISIPESSPGVEPDQSFINGSVWYYNMLKPDLDDNNYEAIRKITNTQYYPEDVLIDNDDGDGNLLGEETFKVDFDGELENTDNGLLMASIFSYKTDLYKTYYNQELVFTGKLNTIALDAVTVYGGDCFISQYSFKLNNVMPTPSELINPYIGILYTVPAYDAANIWMRENGEESWETFYPKSMIHDYETVVADNEEEYLQHGNYYGYNSDFSKLQSSPFYRRFLKQGCAATSNCATDIVTKFPYRIARSLVVADESSEIRFRTFRANDYSELERNTGVISAMLAYSNGLFVTTEYGAYYFDPQNVLQTDQEAIALYGADLFLQKPKPLIESNGGYMGCKSKYTLILTPAGIMFLDITVGRLYLFNGKIDELTADIRYDFEDDFKRIVPILDNPFNGTGATMGYDNDFHRILISSVVSDGKDPNEGITWSYDLDRKEWVCKHDYIPTLYYFSMGGLKTVYNNPSGTVSGEIWWHNENPANPGKYYGTQFDSYLDIVLADKDTSMLVKNINWLTQALTDKDVSHLYTIGEIMVYNQTQSSGLIALVKLSSLPGLGNVNMSRRSNGWTFGSFKDIVIDENTSLFLTTDQPNTANLNANKALGIRPFLSNYLVVRLVMKNPATIELTLIDVGVDLVASKNSTRVKRI